LQNKNKLIEAMKKQEQQAQQMQQSQSQSAQMQEQATLQMAQARAAADTAMAQERMSRINENEQLAVERQAKALQDTADAHNKEEEALLNKVKLLKELQDIDLRQLRELMTLQQAIKNEYEEDINQEKIEQQSLMDKLNMMKQNVAQQPNMGQPNMGQQMPPAMGDMNNLG